ncbi:DUF2911 domain-containing protein [Candidatus Sumerlaeota bacterium]|nr:DUF2911 domain-containing protein [Candidatus Sumerlaeota bacterium]
MKSIRRFGLLVVFLLSYRHNSRAAEPEPGRAELTGNWTIVLAGLPGDPQIGSLGVVKKGDRLEGAFASDSESVLKSLKLLSITVDGPNVVLNCGINLFNQDMKVPLAFKLEGDTFKGDFPLAKMIVKDCLRGARAGTTSEAALLKETQEAFIAKTGPPMIPVDEVKPFMGDWILKWESTQGGQTEAYCSLLDEGGKASARIRLPLPWGTHTINKIIKTERGLTYNFTIELPGSPIHTTVDVEREGMLITGHYEAARGAMKSLVEGCRKGRGLTRITAEEKNVWIEYGRPSVSGPGYKQFSGAKDGLVWRLGEDEATSLKSEADLQFGDTKIKAGRYSLWAKKHGEGDGGWGLVFNTEPDVSGTAHNAAADIAEIPLTSAKLDSPVELLSINLVPDPEVTGEGVFHLAWGGLEETAKFMMKLPPSPQPPTITTGVPSDTVITLLRTPNNGIQPQVAVDAEGTAHLLYFKGPNENGNLYYVRMKPGETAFSAPIRVNSQDGSAVAMGAFSGGQISVGKGGRVHVVWNSSKGGQFLYTRINEQRTAFDSPRNLITFAKGLDGGGSVAADAEGNVYAFWHAQAGDQGEATRAVFVARSTDEGAAFAPEKQASAPVGGACGCCSLRAFCDAAGDVYVLYRAAGMGVNRDTTLLVSHDRGITFESAKIDAWKIGSCPMSSFSLAGAAGKIFAAWETKNEVYTGNIEAGKKEISEIITPASMGKLHKHPVVAGNARGEKLVAWTEGTGRSAGDPFYWQLYDASGKATNKAGRKAGLPEWGMVAVFARPDGSFVVVY